MIPSDVVLIPGWATDSSVWDGLVRRLGRAGATSRCVEWWNCGLGIADCGFVAACLPQSAIRNPQSAILVGWSLGSLLALKAAIEQPERVAGLVLVGGTARHPEADGYPGVSARLLDVMRKRLCRDRKSFLAKFFHDCLAPESDSETEARLCERAEQIDDERLLAGWDHLASADLRLALSAIIARTLVIHGREDAIVPPACGQYLAREIPHAEFRLVANAGHAIPLTQADRLAEWMDEFRHDCCTG